MAFEIEALTVKQREQFAVKQIPDPLSPVLGILKPREWIIDAGKDVFLFAIGVHRDYPNEELFFFHWKAQEMILPLRKENQLPNTRIWSFQTSWENPLRYVQGNIRSQMLADLKQALEVYRADGTSDPSNLAVQVVCDF